MRGETRFGDADRKRCVAKDYDSWKHPPPGIDANLPACDYTGSSKELILMGEKKKRKMAFHSEWNSYHAYQTVKGNLKLIIEAMLKRHENNKEK